MSKSCSAGDFGAVVVSQNAMYFNERRQIADIALANRIEIVVPADVFVEAGALRPRLARYFSQRGRIRGPNT